MPDKYLRLPDVLLFAGKLILTTAQQYKDAASGLNNEAGTQIDKGKEPYLISVEALEYGTEPLVPVWDVMRDHRIVDGRAMVVLSTAGRDAIVPQDTLLAWN